MAAASVLISSDITSEGAQGQGEGEIALPVQDLQDLCAICHEAFRLPKLLSCLHSVCEACVKGCIAVDNDTALVVCPVKDCASRTSIPQGLISALPTNYLILSRQQSAIGLSWCGECVDAEVAESYCNDCGMFLCTFHVEHHKKSRSTAGHKLNPMNAVKLSGAVVGQGRQQILCPFHAEESLSLFCVGCQQLCCSQCKCGGHEGHDVLPANEAVDMMAGKLKEEMQRAALAVPEEEAEQLVAKVNGKLDQVEDEAQAASDKITAAIGELKQALDVKEQCLLKKVDELRSLREAELEEQLIGLQQVTSRLKLSMTTGEEVLSQLSSIEKLYLFPVLQKNLSKFDSQLWAKQRTASEEAVKPRTEISFSNDVFPGQKFLRMIENEIGEAAVYSESSKPSQASTILQVGCTRHSDEVDNDSFFVASRPAPALNPGVYAGRFNAHPQPLRLAAMADHNRAGCAERLDDYRQPFWMTAMADKNQGDCDRTTAGVLDSSGEEPCRMSLFICCRNDQGKMVRRDADEIDLKVDIFSPKRKVGIPVNIRMVNKVTRIGSRFTHEASFTPRKTGTYPVTVTVCGRRVSQAPHSLVVEETTAIEFGEHTEPCNLLDDDRRVVVGDPCIPVPSAALGDTGINSGTLEWRLQLFGLSPDSFMRVGVAERDAIRPGKRKRCIWAWRIDNDNGDEDSFVTHDYNAEVDSSFDGLTDWSDGDILHFFLDYSEGRLVMVDERRGTKAEVSDMRLFGQHVYPYVSLWDDDHQVLSLPCRSLTAQR